MLVEDEEENKRMEYGIEWWLLGRLEEETKKQRSLGNHIKDPWKAPQDISKESLKIVTKKS